MAASDSSFLFPGLAAARDIDVVVNTPATETPATSLPTEVLGVEAAASAERHQKSELPEIDGVFWGDPEPEGGVTIFTSDAGFAVLKGEDEQAARLTALRMAGWLISQPRWAEAESARHRNSIANEILCHAEIDDQDMSIEYHVDTLQDTFCTTLGLPLGEQTPPDGTIIT